MTDHHIPEMTPQILTDAAEWLAYGIARGWISESFCGTHDYYDGFTASEIASLVDLDDPCMTVVRIL